MARGTPSMVALLGLLAVAGYQNREKIAEMINSFKNKGPTGDPLQDGAREVLGKLGDVAGSAGNLLNEGLGGLVDQFKQSGHGDLADSWVGKGPNQPVSTSQLESAIGSDILGDLAKRTGLTREEILSRLSRDLPGAVDGLTPEGRVPG
ncbi:MAG: YidB family protein [Rhizobiales bacterium]|nr:YidB family protein [Hyphomicrobiales bacterium]